MLRRFERADSGVLVGTQMVAKGHDFPEVTLGVVLDADGTLRLPDFRAEERTFALITQLAGRSGRGEAGGKVLVQTLATGAPSIRHAAGHDSAGFLAEELERRRALRYPPFSHLIEVGLSSPEEEPLDTSAEAAAGAGRPSGSRPRPSCSARLRSSGCAAGTAAGCWSSRRTAPPRWRRSARRSRRRSAGRLLGEVSISVDVDPQ